MQFSSLYTELGDRLGAFDPTVATDLVKLKRWVNMGVQYICGKRLWPFMLAEEIVQTVPDVTAGAVSIAAGGTTVSLTVAPVDSCLGRYIQVATTQDWYKIVAHTAGDFTIVISPPYVGTSTYSAGTYTIRKLLYTTATPLVQILDMKQLVTPVRLVSQSPRDADFFLPLYYSAGTPYYYIISSPSPGGNVQFSLLRSPDTTMNIMIRGIRNLTDMTGDTDEPLIPIPWQDAILNIAAYYGFQSLDDTRGATELTVGESRIKDMMTNYSQDPGRHRVMQAITNDSNFGLQWALPSDFGPEVPY